MNLNFCKSSDITDVAEFYTRNKIISSNRTWNDIIAMNDEQLEFVHNYIQWLFPTSEKSNFNFNAPVVSEEEINNIPSDIKELIQERLLVAFKRMMSFYGFEVSDNDNIIKVKITNYSNLNRWLSRNNHNFLRLTRIMKSLKLFGLSEYSNSLKTVLLQIADNNLNIVGHKTREHWENC